MSSNETPKRWHACSNDLRAWVDDAALDVRMYVGGATVNGERDRRYAEDIAARLNAQPEKRKPLTEEQALGVGMAHGWDTDHPEVAADVIEIVRAIEREHGITQEGE